MTAKCYLGIDGGATNTGAVIINNRGAILATARGLGSAVVAEPSPESREVLLCISRKVLAAAGLTTDDIAHCAIGLAGVDFDDELAVQFNSLCDCLQIHSQHTTLVNDAIVALWGASSSETSAILQLGTAFTSAFRSRYGSETLFDHLNTGNTYDIRTELCVIISRMIDGRVTRTPLMDAVLESFGVEHEDDYRERLYRGRIPAAAIRNTPPLLFNAWENDDPAAATIIENALDDYALAAHAMIRRIGTRGSDMVFGGGVIQRAPTAFWDALERRITDSFPEVNVHPPCLPPECGAALMAAFNGGEDARAVFSAMAQQHNDAITNCDALERRNEE